MVTKIIIYVMAIVVLITLVVVGCTVTKYTTRSVPAVKEFELNRYLGTWYEIARIPNTFEKDLEQVTANYGLREDGKINVINRGYNARKDKWQEVRGKAWIPDKLKPAEFKVSFIWPLAGEYKVIHLEEDYSQAIVAGSGFEYLWILSRTPDISDEKYDELVQKAGSLGFDTSRLMKVSQM